MYFRAAVLSCDAGVYVIGMCSGKGDGKRKKNTPTVTVTWLGLLFTLCIVFSLVIQNVIKISHMNVTVRVLLFFRFPSLPKKWIPIMETAKQDGELATLKTR